MRLKVVMENSVSPQVRLPLCGQHGLSFLIEHEEERLLFDVGQSAVTVHNLNYLGVELKHLTGIILSHGHYDHTAGLEAVLGQRRHKIPVYIGQNFFAGRFSVAGGQRRYIAIPYCRQQLDSLGAEFQFVNEPLELAKNLWISGKIPCRTDFEQGDVNLVTDEGQDLVDDELALYYLSSKGLVVITGCAHNGIINIIRHGMEITQADRLAAIIGGTHLGAVSHEQQEHTVSVLKQLQPQLIAANHCTGFAMMNKLAQEFGTRFIYAAIGTELTL